MGTIESNHLLQFVLIIGLVASIFANVVMVVSTMSNRKQRREVSFSADYATRQELKIVKDDVEKLAVESRAENAAIRAKMEQDKQEIMQAGEQRAAGIYGNMKDMEHNLRDELTATRRELAKKVDDKTSEIIRLLKDTGAIK